MYPQISFRGKSQLPNFFPLALSSCKFPHFSTAPWADYQVFLTMAFEGNPGGGVKSSPAETWSWKKLTNRQTILLTWGISWLWGVFSDLGCILALTCRFMIPLLQANIQKVAQFCPTCFETLWKWGVLHLPCVWLLWLVVGSLGVVFICL